MTLCFIFLFFVTTAAFAQDTAPSPAAVYNVADVAVDVTSDSAAKARDQAIAEAQRMAFAQLLDRLGAPATIGAKLSDNDLATLVQNFEVRNERASAVRYIGTFAVQFRPAAVRNFLNKRNASYNDAQGQPVLVLPVTKSADRAILWEEPTRWQKLWSDAAHDSGIVPVIVPTGAAEDKPLLNTADAVAGKTDAIKAMADKYQSNGAVVAVLNLPAATGAAPYTVDIQHFGGGYDDASDVEHIVLSTSTGRTDADDAILMQGIQQVRHILEKEWKGRAKDSAALSVAAPASAPAPTPAMTWSDEEPPSRLPVTVQIATLAEWADMQRRMMATPGVRRVDVTALERGAAQIELGFAGTPQDIQNALAQHNLRLTQDILSGLWFLKNI